MSPSLPRLSALMLLSLLAACKEEETGPPIDEAAAARGEELAEGCKACHSLTQKTNLVGPHLVDILGRPVASISGFEYSDDLASREFSWDVAQLEAFILDPTAMVPETKMAFGGIDEAEASDIVEYIRSLDR